VPLILRRPGGAGAGKVCGDLVSLVDLAPAGLRLAGIEPSPRLQGRDFTGADDGKARKIPSRRGTWRRAGNTPPCSAGSGACWRRGSPSGGDAGETPEDPRTAAEALHRFHRPNTERIMARRGLSLDVDPADFPAWWEKELGGGRREAPRRGGGRGPAGTAPQRPMRAAFSRIPGTASSMTGRTSSYRKVRSSKVRSRSPRRNRSSNSSK